MDSEYPEDEDVNEEEEDFIADEDADISEDPDEDGDGAIAGGGEDGGIRPWHFIAGGHFQN